MKNLSALLILLLVGYWPQTVGAQAADTWVNVSPAGETFTIQMPNSYVVKSQQNGFGQLKVNANIYTASSDDVEYTVWSLVNEGYANNGWFDNDAYLDACADLVWELLLKPLRDQLPKSPKVVSYMSYQRELVSSKLPGREYFILLGNRYGVIHFYVAGPQIHVLTVLNADANFGGTQRFVNSLRVKGSEPAGALEDPVLVPPSAGVRPGEGIGPGRGGNMGRGNGKVVGGTPSAGTSDSTDYNRIFTGREVTEKARVLSKPEPQYTESARKYSVQGTVVLRAVFSGSGQVNNIRVVQKLPHGLTQRAVSAARQITFTPAVKDGHAVSMYIQLEYNFNLF
jgi:TonB family protein